MTKRTATSLGIVLIAALALSCGAPDLEEVEQQPAPLEGSLSGRVFGTRGVGLRVREEPNTTSAQIDSVWDGDLVSITCQTRGELVDGTDVWDYIASPRGYVSDAYVRTGHDGFAPGAQRCGAEAGPTEKATDEKKSPASSGGSLSAIWGGRSAPITFEYLSPGGLYGYGTAYGLNGIGHTGIDVGISFGTPLFAPRSGEVTCAGTGDGPGAGGGGCAAFGDTGDGPPNGRKQGVGRIELELDDGTVLILGHSRSCSVRPGQRVERGQQVGTSGGMNGAHVHVEARIRDASTSSGWRIVDPRLRLGQ